MKNNNEILVEAKGVGKKFARDLMTSLKYGLTDISREIVGLPLKEELRKGEFWAVDDVSFTLRRGECLGLIGHNGAGKSTLLKMLNGLIKPDKGSITMRGRIGALIELGAGFNPILTGRENIYINGQVLGFSRKEIDQKFDDIVDFAEIGDFIDAPVQNYSSGMKVRLGFAVASQMEPDVLLIDEVLAVGDIGFRTKCYQVINDMLLDSAIIFVSHSMAQISRICSDLIFLDHGNCEYKGKELSTGIDRYLEKFKMQNTQTIGDQQSVIIDNLTLKGDNNGLFYNGNKIQIEIKGKMKKNLNHFYLMISFTDQELKYVAMVNSEFDHFIFHADEEGEFVGKVSFINQFAPGKYSLNFHFIEPDDNDRNLGFCTMQAIKTIMVKGSKVYTQIPIQLSADWK